jgi:hypothetical protein
MCLDKKKRQTLCELHGEIHVTYERKEKPRKIKNDLSIYIYVSRI